MKIPAKSRSAVLFVSPRLTLLLALSIPHHGSAQQRTLVPPEFVNWPPVTDAEREIQSPRVEKDAGAEVLLWRVHIADEVGGRSGIERVFYHYIKLKIFDEKGKEKAATINLPYREPGGIQEVAGRTIKPDGAILELDKKSIYKRDIARGGGLNQKVISFAMPGVERGAIIEYRWKQTEDDNRFQYFKLQFQREFPVQRVTYFFKPLDRPLQRQVEYFKPFHCNPSPLRREPDGYTSTTLENVPASRDEPLAPTQPNWEPWALLAYREGPTDPLIFWNTEGRKLYGEFKASLNSNAEMKSAAADAVTGANSVEEKITALTIRVRKILRNVSEPDVPAAERQGFIEKYPKNHLRTSTEIFKSGLATSVEMNFLFGALAMQAGLEVRPALIADRRQIAFDPKTMADRYFLGSAWPLGLGGAVVAVRVGETWKIVDVSDRVLPPGMLPWQEEGVYALLGDPDDPRFIKTPAAPPEVSTELRTAHLSLSAQGSLEGDVEESYTGHRAEEFRRQLITKSPAQREEWFRDRVIRMFPDAEVTMKLEAVDDSSKPLLAHYHLKARYAQVIGNRLLFQPIAFRRTQIYPAFAAQERTLPVVFPNGWKEVDQIHIQLPAGYTLDNADSPGSLDFGVPGSYKLEMRVTNGNNPELSTSRELTFGREGKVFFDPTVYPTLKKVFNEIETRDRHSISLKRN
jgi:Domain of Unknown Function with PDB structure (DUF3857)